MTSGTRIALAVIAVLATVLVIYYGFIADPGQPLPPVVNDPTTSGADEPVIAPAQEPQQPKTSPAQPPAMSAAARDKAGSPLRRGGSDRQEVPPRTLGREEPALVPVQEIESPRRSADGGEPDLAARSPQSTRPAAPTELGRSSSQSDADPAAPGQTSRRRAADAPPAAVSSPPTPRPEYRMYTVKQGDSLSSIARWWFDDPERWDAILRANPSLKDPHRLRIGQTLRLPPRETSRTPRMPTPRDAASRAVHIVRSGETLSSIAERYYRDATLWTRLYEANRRLIGDDPDAIEVGMRLRIPRR